MSTANPLWQEAEENRRQQDAQLAADWLERFAQMQADLLDAQGKCNSDKLRNRFLSMTQELWWFRQDHIIAELKGWGDE